MLKLYMFQVRCKHKNGKYGFARMELIAAINPQEAREIVHNDHESTKVQYDVAIKQLNPIGIKVDGIKLSKKIGGGWLNWKVDE